MIVTFFGNARLYHDREIIYFKVYEILDGILRENPNCELFCGCKGDFDLICVKAITALKVVYPNNKCVYISPYFNIAYQKNYLSRFSSIFDDIIFPDVLESCPMRAAYPERNKWMIDSADLVISYVAIGGGGAEVAFNYAKKRKKEIISISF